MIILSQPSKDIDVRRLPTDPTRAYRHVPVIEVDDLLEAAPRDTAVVAVEIVPDAIALPDFVHPERACYVFGPESGAVSRPHPEAKRPPSPGPDRRVAEPGHDGRHRPLRPLRRTVAANRQPTGRLIRVLLRGPQ